MSERVVIGGRGWAVGLEWQPRLRGAALAREAAATERPYYVQSGGQTGLADETGVDIGGQPSLGASLREFIAAPSWIAAAEIDGGTGSAVVIRMAAGEIPPGGETVHADHGAAKEDVARAREQFPDAAVFATAGLGIEGATVLDPGEIVPPPGSPLETVPLPGTSTRMAGLAAAAAGLVLLVGAAAWFAGDIIELITGPEEVVEAPPPPPEVEVVIDGAALIGACAEALDALPPERPGWTMGRVSCSARLTDATVLEVLPELRDRAAMVVRWSLTAQHAPTVHRRLLEDEISAIWPVGAVTGTAAWAALELTPVLRPHIEAPPPPFLALRREVDRRIGAWATGLAYRTAGQAGVVIDITGPAPLERAMAALDGIEGLEVTGLHRESAAAWQIAARPHQPRRILESLYLRLTSPINPDWYTPSGGSDA